MKKFAVFSGFLGSGKTTTMMALSGTKVACRNRVAMISNDLGKQTLADHRLAVLAGCNASELTGECICYQTENLVHRLDHLFEAQGYDLVISDIPGFGVGALEHVYHTLADRRNKYDLAPFTVLIEPDKVRCLMERRSNDLEYILHTQLLEADLIVLNKCDLLDREDRLRLSSWLENAYPQAQVMGISARTGEGVDELLHALMDGSASMHRPEIGYGGTEFHKAMGMMSEFYVQYYATVCCNTFDGNAYLLALGERVSREIKAYGKEIPHLKLLAWEPEGDYGKADLLGVDRPVEASKMFRRPCTELAVILNASAVCPGALLDLALSKAIESISEEYNLTLMIFRKECFGMGG